MMAANSTDIMWGPGVIGFVIATAFYGTAFGQYIFYLKYFSQDSKRLKLFIMMVFCLGTINEFALIGMYWSILISCRRSTSLVCTTELPWQMLATGGIYVLFAVHCFYIHRVWIITEHNRLITGIICVFAATSLVFGMITSGLIFFTRSPADLFGKKWAQGSAVAGALCDILITGTVWWFLRPARTGNVRRPNYLEQLTQMFVNMGLFSCIVAITMVVLYQVQNSRLDQFYSAVPGSLLGKTYLNSMMAVLNARKSIRERQQLEVGLSSMELPTIPTIR